MKIKAKNNRFSLELKIPRSCEATYPSLRKLKRGNTQESEDKLNGVWTLLKGCQVKGKRYHEPFGGIGLSAQVANSLSMSVSVNELDSGLYSFLCEQYDEVTNEDADKLIMDRVPFRFFDRNHFTFNHIGPAFNEALIKTTKVLLYTDVFPFSLKPFDMLKLKLYLKRCKARMEKEGWYIQKVFLYRNRHVMIVKMTKNKSKKQIIKVETEPTDPFEMTIDIGLFG